MNEERKKSNPFLENGLPICLFLLIALLYFREYIFGGMIPFGRDDAITYQPQRWFFTEGIRNGYVPLWCPNIGFGHPMAAEGQCTLFHPFTFIFFIFSFYKAYTISVVICYPLFAFFLYRLCRTWGLQREGSILCAILVTFGGAYLLWQGHYAIISTLLWLPLLMLYLIKACRESGGKYIALGALFYALMIFSGGIQFTYVGTIFAFLFLLTIGDGGRSFPLRVVLRTAIPIFVIGALIGTVQILPLYELTSHSERAGAFFDASSGEMQWHQLSSLGTALFYASGGVKMAEGAILGYVGFLGTLLAILGITASKRKWPVILLGMVCIIISLGGVTTLGLFRESRRMIFFFALTAGIYAGQGLDIVLRNNENVKTIRRNALVSTGIFIILSLLSASNFLVSSAGGYLRLFAPAVVAIGLLFAIIYYLKRFPAVAAGIVIIFGLAGSVYSLNWGNRETAVPRTALEKIPPVADALQELAGEGRVWISLDVDERNTMHFHDNAYGPRALLYDLVTTDHETPLTVRGVMSFQRKTIKCITGSIEGDKNKIPRADILAGLQYIAVPPDVAEKLPFGDVCKRIDTTPPFAIVKLPDYKGTAFFIFPRNVDFVSDEESEFNIDGFVYDADGSVESITLTGPEREIRTSPSEAYANRIGPNVSPNRWKIEYSALEGSFLFISQVKYPGWKAYINGKPVPLYKTYGLFSGVIVDEPEGIVELRYQPSSWKWGAIITLVGLCLWIYLLLVSPKTPHPLNK